MTSVIRTQVLIVAQGAFITNDLTEAYLNPCKIDIESIDPFDLLIINFSKSLMAQTLNRIKNGEFTEWSSKEINEMYDEALSLSNGPLQHAYRFIQMTYDSLRKASVFEKETE